MIAIVSDTHGIDGHRLAGRTLAAVREAELVVHAGDFTTEAVLDAFESVAGADVGGAEFVAVTGNNETRGVRDRLPSQQVVERAGVRLAVVHGHEHTDEALSLLGRQENAAVVVGHSHRPGVRQLGATTVLNPGSHADPRRYRAAHAELEPTDEGLSGRIRTPDGETLAEFDLP